MKKLLIVFACVISALCASAEKGDKVVGVHFLDNPKFEPNAIGAGASFRYSFSDHFRTKVQASFLSASEASGVDASLDFQWAFPLGEKFDLYPTLGIGFTNIGEISNADILFGAGVDYYITEHWGLNLEARAQKIFSTDGIGYPISIGVTYTF